VVWLGLGRFGVGFWVTLRAWDFPTERALPRSLFFKSLIIRAVCRVEVEVHLDPAWIKLIDKRWYTGALAPVPLVLARGGGAFLFSGFSPAFLFLFFSFSSSFLLLFFSFSSPFLWI
jgi:hypothetical protein